MGGRYAVHGKLMKACLSAVLIPALAITSPLLARDQLVVDLKFIPAPKITATGIQGDTAMLSIPLNLVIASSTPPAAQDKIGENRENEKKFVPIYAKGPVSAHVNGAIRSLLGGWGAHIGPDAKLQLEAEVVQFNVVETNRYHGDVKIRFALKNPSGAVLWEGLKVGATARFGRSLSEANYNETLSDSLATCVVALINDVDFRAAWSGKPRPVDPPSAAAAAPAGAPSGTERSSAGLTPVEMKEKLAALQKEGFTDDLLVAFVRQTRLSSALTAEDMLDWKRSGLSQVVVKAALDSR